MSWVSRRMHVAMYWLVVVALIVVPKVCEGQQQPLSTDFYKNSCPNLVNIVRQTMATKFNQTPVAAAGTLRIFFHDCMVEGCDASVLVSSTQSNKAEKDADVNLSLPGDGFDAVMKAKAAVEAKCPGIVSCSDLLALCTRELLVLIGGPSWDVRLGRRDGLLSQASRVAGNLPMPNMTIDQLTALFNRKGLSQKDMVALSGAHTAGFAHCNQFMDRIYNWQNTGRIDPSMNPLYAAELREACPRMGLDPTVVANLDPSTPKLFDNVFYKNAQVGRALLRSDQMLFNDNRTKALVNQFASSPADFFAAFKAAIDKMSAIGVKTGSQGEIRRSCGAVN